jgi:hypothetical protein
MSEILSTVSSITLSPLGRGQGEGGHRPTPLVAPHPDPLPRGERE